MRTTLEGATALAAETEGSRWDFAEGDEITPGLSALKRLGGGRRYDAYLAWDERLHALVVAKLLRPDQAEDERARGALMAEAALLRELAHHCSCARSARWRTDRGRISCWSR
jgi:serine/threonine-protein kinase